MRTNYSFQPCAHAHVHVYGVFSLLLACVLEQSTWAASCDLSKLLQL